MEHKTMYEKECRYCGNPYRSPRSDSVYCSDNCKARFDRLKGQYKGYVHSEKDRWVNCSCENCGGTFWVNEYAVRGGQRVAKFCTTRCRVAAHRAKGKDPFQQTYYGHTTHEQARNTPPKGKKTAPPPPPPPPPPPSGKTHYYVHRDGIKKAFEWLGVSFNCDFKVCKQAYIRLIKLYHPDGCKLHDAVQLAQATNVAWEVCQAYYEK